MAKLIWQDVGNWANSTHYVCGDLAEDIPTSTKYYCAVEHTSAAAGTFEDERTAEPTFWRLALQDIPSAIRTLYDGTITPAMPGDAIRGRYPWRKPNKQLNGYAVSLKEQEQRTRWLEIRNKFKNIDAATRARWYDARPVWHSLLWYYNYFMMSGLLGNAVIGNKGAGVIKDINHYNFTLGTGANPEATIAIDACDPAKTMCFFYGAGWQEVLSGVVAVMYPFQKSLNSSQLIAQVSPGLGEAVVFGVSIIEYI